MDDIKFKHLFLGTNERYYNTVEKVIKDYPDHSILTYEADYVKWQTTMYLCLWITS